MWFKQFKAVFNNAFRVSAGDPFYLVISLALAVSMMLASSMPSLGESEHLRLVRDQSHSILFLCGGLAVIFAMIRVVTDDLRRGSGAILMSRPISGSTLIAGKFMGVLASLSLLVFTGSIAYLWISEITYSNEELNVKSLCVFVGAIFLALAAGASRQYMYGNNYSFYSSCALAVTLTLGFLMRLASSGKELFDFVGLQSIAFLFLALVSFAAVVLLVAVIADSAMTLAFSLVIFGLGLLSEYFFGRLLGGLFGDVLLSVFPNWQSFWVLEKLGLGESIPVFYFGECLVHVLLFSFVYLLLSVMVFDRSEIKGVA